MMPETIGRYRLLRKLGAGGMGEVYLAEDSALKRRVAIKFVVPAAADDASHAERLVREAQAAAALDHPNVCAIYEVSEYNGQPFFAMQYVEGGTLADRLAQGPLPLPETLLIAGQAADALAAAHAQGIAHRDVKPQNIMLTPKGQVKVLDFGLAKRALRTDSDTTLAGTADGVVAGTTAYMSPEQLRGETVDAATDVFSFGCVLHEMVNGRHPFARTSAAETIASILGAEPPPLVSTAPAELQRIASKCLQKDRAQRYQSAADLAIDLRNLSRVASASGAEIARSAPRRFSPRTFGLVTIATCLVAIAVASIWWRREGPAPPSVRVIAILPLVTVDQASAYLGDGISESVINSLSRLPQVKVLARTTTFRYRGPSVDPGALRRELGVDAVLTGAVQQRDGALVVQAELIDTADNTQLWGERYNNRRVTDVFEVQEEIARAIATSLRLELTGREAGFSKRYTDNVEAYRAYVLGREYAQRRTLTDLESAISHYKQAISLDGAYALAWAGLTDAYINLCARGALTYRECRRLAFEAAERARTLDPDLAEAHAALGQTQVYIGPFNFELGDRALRRAIELNPGWPLAHQYLAVSLLEQGRIAEGVTALETARSQDPLSGFITRFLAFAYLLQGETDRALTTYRSAASSGPQFATIWEAELFVRAGAVDEGLKTLQNAATGRGDEPNLRLNRAVLEAATGRKGEARSVAQELERYAAGDPISARSAARIYMALGEYDKALDLMTQSIDAGAMPIFYKVEPLWEPVRKDPRFRALLRKMQIPE